MRLVVTGAGGALARAFLAQVPAHHEVHAFDHAGLDVGDHDAVRRTVEPLRPDAVDQPRRVHPGGRERDRPGCAPRATTRWGLSTWRWRRARAAPCSCTSPRTSSSTAPRARPTTSWTRPRRSPSYGRAKLAGEAAACAHLVPEHFDRARRLRLRGRRRTTSRRRCGRWPPASRSAGWPTAWARRRTSHDLAARLLLLLLTRPLRHVSPGRARARLVVRRPHAGEAPSGGCPGEVRPQTARRAGAPGAPAPPTARSRACTCRTSASRRCRRSTTPSRGSSRTRASAPPRVERHGTATGRC